MIFGLVTDELGTSHEYLQNYLSEMSLFMSVRHVYQTSVQFRSGKALQGTSYLTFCQNDFVKVVLTYTILCAVL